MILLTDSVDPQFIVLMAKQVGSSLSIELPTASSAPKRLAQVIEEEARGQLGLQIRFLGFVEFSVEADCRIVAAVVLTDPAVPKATKLGQDLRILSEADIRDEHITDLALYDAAREWCITEIESHTLNERISSAVESSIAYLSRNLSHERPDDAPLERETSIPYNGLWGWSMLMDQTDVGVLSTAQGILAYRHADRQPSDTIGSAVESLERLQNTDGGWRVRRALTGNPSDKSVTESTCYCVWALLEIGRPHTDPVVSKAVTWLREHVQQDGGWASTADGTESHLYPTALAVRVLARCEHSEELAQGLWWLRQAQDPDSGAFFAPKRPQGWDADDRRFAYTAHAVLSLLAAGVPEDDDVIRSACGFLSLEFDEDGPEPWPSRATTTRIDRATASNMEFKHFATPWVIAALITAGHGVDDMVVLRAVEKLLKRQLSDGRWRCELADNDRTTLWALHDALFALRTIRESTRSRLPMIALSRQRDDERKRISEALTRLLAATAPQPAPQNGIAWRRFLYGWLAALTVFVLLLLLAQLGFDLFGPGSALRKVLGTVGAFILAVATATVPQVVTEEHKRRRGREERHQT
ncbi:prenyltransferase/squalene oxidase repeat-containing protein [Cryptosporangium phraense]|uniref:Terpene cyclase/mutase family protein n=1 Tax=Cryptosporangium phraense TaxID=2593070 RepID=A0A545AES9_9ACTN|nr:prenyltransferase/squalene oxidase repeat-containing protein [Cryptosporangium phraense]TQS39841.1 terpene cyclase/mutase family protein [Cryptosporangium phraense]